MERIKVKKTVQIAGVFSPVVKVGSSVKPGEILGKARVPTLLETHLLEHGTALIDDGVFVTSHTPLIQYKRGFHKETVGSVHEGIVKMNKKSLSVVSDDREEDVLSKTWGRVLSLAETSYLIEINYIKIPIFVSQGNFVEAQVLSLLHRGAIIAPHHVTEDVREKIVLLPGAISKETYAEIMKRGALGILAPSIDWHDYLAIFADKNANIAILHGFGMFPLWRWYHHLLSRLDGVEIQVDFAQSYLSIPVSDILMGSLEQDLLLFKEYWWGKQVRALQHESGDLIATLETGEQTPVMAEELFNIR
jgi:hypothetical protein